MENTLTDFTHDDSYFQIDPSSLFLFLIFHFLWFNKCRSTYGTVLCQKNGGISAKILKFKTLVFEQNLGVK